MTFIMYNIKIQVMNISSCLFVSQFPINLMDKPDPNALLP